MVARRKNIATNQTVFAPMLLKLLETTRANALKGMPMKKEGTPCLYRSLAVGQRRLPQAPTMFAARTTRPSTIVAANDAANFNDVCRSNIAIY